MHGCDTEAQGTDPDRDQRGDVVAGPLHGLGEVDPGGEQQFSPAQVDGRLDQLAGGGPGDGRVPGGHDEGQVEVAAAHDLAQEHVVDVGPVRVHGSAPSLPFWTIRPVREFS